MTLTMTYGVLKVSGLEEGETYVFRVRAANDHGVGKPSQLSEPVCARALPGNSQSMHYLSGSFCMLGFHNTVFVCVSLPFRHQRD